MPPKNEMGSATTAATIPSNPSLEGFLSLPMPLEAAHIHLLKMALFTPRLGRLGREDREKEVIDKDIFEIVRGMWERAMLPSESSSLGLAFRIALCSILVDNAWKHATFTCCGLKFFLRVLRNFLPKFSRCPPRSYLAAGQMMVQQKKISGGSPPYNTYIKPAMGALFQAVGPPLLEFPLSFEKMTHRRKPGASPAVHLPLASGNKGKTAGLAVSRTSESVPTEISSVFALLLQPLFLYGFALFALLICFINYFDRNGMDRS